MRTIRFGIIGCGDVTEVKSGPAFQKIEGCHLAAVMRRDPEKVKDYAQRHGVEKYTTQYLEILQDPEIDAVYIATPPNMHHFYTLEAAKYHKAVYVEKPMALTVKECEEMVAACKAQSVPLFVAYYRRGQEKFQKAKELLTGGAIGEIRAFHYDYACPVPTFKSHRAWLLSKAEAGGGLLYDIGSHMMDILLFFFGGVAVATGLSENQSKSYDIKDVTSGLIRFQNGVQGTVQLSFNTAAIRDELMVYGSEGSMRLAIMSNDPIILTNGEKQETFSFAPLNHVQMPYIEKVVRTLNGRDDLDATGIDGQRTQEILEAFEESRTIRYGV